MHTAERMFPPQTSRLFSATRRFIDGRALVMLALGFTFLVLSNGRFAVPIAAWIAPVFLLRFLRQVPTWRGALLLYAVAFVAFLIAWFRWIPVPGLAFVGMAAGIVLVQVFPYVVDRFTYRRLPRGAAALVLPTGMVTMNYVMSLASPYGSWGDIAYSQIGNLPLIQSLSVVGVAGITFLIYWSAATATDVWAHGFSWKIAGFPAAALVAVLVLGGLRVGQSDGSVPTARIASVVVDHGDLFPAIDRMGFDLTSRAATPPEVEQILGPHQEELLALTEREARAGADLVAWAEASAIVRQPEEAALVARAAVIAARHNVYIVMGLLTYMPGEALAANKLVTIGPDGSMAAEYIKTKIVPGDQNVRGDGEVVVIDTPFGRIAQFICFDLDFPAFARQASRAGADIVLAPSNDWREIAVYHGSMAAYRGIENGAAVVRPARNGRSLAVDAYGRTLAVADYVAASPHIMVSNVSSAGVTTVYGRFGDALAWGCVLAFVSLAAVAAVRARHTTRLEQPRDEHAL